MYHTLFIHLSVKRHLGCFYLLATVNATMYMGVQISLWDPFFSIILAIYPEVDMLACIFNFLRHRYTFNFVKFSIACSYWTNFIRPEIKLCHNNQSCRDAMWTRINLLHSFPSFMIEPVANLRSEVVSENICLKWNTSRYFFKWVSCM